MKYCLILHLDAPMQSWGIESRYNRRLAGVAPSKSALCGMVCAALGAGKESGKEKETVNGFFKMRLITVEMHTGGEGSILRDYHTVQGTRKADNGKNSAAVLTHRFYHSDKRFAALLISEDRDFLERMRQALQNPVWGVWLGRKCCIPAAPIIQEEVIPVSEEPIKCIPQEVEDILREKYPDTGWELYEEVARGDSEIIGADAWRDSPESFGSATSSGREKREYGMRYVRHSVKSFSKKTDEVSPVSGNDLYFQF